MDGDQFQSMATVLPSEMVDAPWIVLGRAAVSPGAQALVAATLDTIKPHLAATGSKAIGLKSRPSWLVDVGNVMAGVMRPGGDVVSAQRGKGQGIWSGDRNGIGHQRFWRIVDAMKAAGLLWERKGTKSNARHEKRGYATRLAPTAGLMEMAAAFGVTPETRRHDWRLDPLQVAQGGHGGSVVIKAWNDTPADLALDAQHLAEMTKHLDALNRLNASVTIRGAGPVSTLYRLFNATLDLGGRHYGPAYLNVPSDERLGITMDGEVVVEIDLKAAQVTILAGLTGMVGADGTLPFSDPYEAPGLPRAAVKRWVTKTLGKGGANLWRPQDEHWGEDDPVEVLGTSFHDVKAAMVGRFPFLGDLRDLVPPGVLDGFPVKDRGKAAGLYFTAREAGIVTSAMACCVAQGVPVLPVHDAIIVPASAERVGVDALTGATFALAGVVPRVEVERA